MAVKAFLADVLWEIRRCVPRTCYFIRHGELHPEIVTVDRFLRDPRRVTRRVDEMKAQVDAGALTLIAGDTAAGEDAGMNAGEDSRALATGVRAVGAQIDMVCRVCGNSISIQPGETLLATDERLCPHIAVR